MSTAQILAQRRSISADLLNAQQAASLKLATLQTLCPHEQTAITWHPAAEGGWAYETCTACDRRLRDVVP